MHSFKSIGLLEPNTPIAPADWTDFARAAAEAKLGTPIPRDTASLTSAIEDLVDASTREETFDALRFFGVVPHSGESGSPATPLALPSPTKPTAPIDLFASVLASKLRYQPHERDLVLLHHEIVAETSDAAGKGEELHTSSLVAYGDARASAMARCVGLPLAFAVRAVLDGQVSARGVCGPGADRAIWSNVLSELQRVGLGMQEKVMPMSGNRLSLEASLLWLRK